VKNILKRLSWICAFLLTVGCANIPNAPEITQEVSTVANIDVNCRVCAPTFCQTISLPLPGQQNSISPISVSPGQTLRIYLELPNNTLLDYDAYLYEIDALGSLTLVDYISGLHNSIPECVGVHNTSNTTKNYLFLAQSYQGGSSTPSINVRICVGTSVPPCGSAAG